MPWQRFQRWLHLLAHTFSVFRLGAHVHRGFDVYEGARTVGVLCTCGRQWVRR